MASAAQIQANRANAQKSTGPRTPAGKAVVGQNAVKHGLLGEQVVVAGEDRARFAQHRDAMLRTLGPIEEVEITLAERLVGLSWRLQRVQRLQVQAFEALCAGAGAAQAGADEELALGRIVVQDFSQGRVLDRLLVYERRLEHSLCRILGELRKERLFHNMEARTMDEGNPQVLLERFMGKLRDSPTATLHVEPGAAWYEETPAPDSAAETAEELWEKVVSGEYDISQGRPALETSQLTPPAAEAAPAGAAGLPHATERVGEPNPIEDVSSAKGEVSSEESPASSPPASRFTGGVLSLKCKVLSEESPAVGLPTSNFTRKTSNLTPSASDESWQTNPISQGIGTGLPNATSRIWGPSQGSGGSEPAPDPRPLIPGVSCETNPIGPDAQESQVLEEQGVMSDALQNGLEKTKPIFAQDGACPCLVEPVGAGEVLAAGPAR